MSWKQELWPEWEIVCDIGSGAYGTVYKIKRHDIGGTYFSALKVISFPYSSHELELMQNQNMSDDQISKYYHGMALDISKEFAIMEKLKGNSNIVSYEDHKIVPHKDKLGWDILIRMELLTSLPKYLETHPMDEKEVCKFGIDICNALILCEKEKIIHRDIKPGNIFVSEYGDYKLGDFSLVKHVELKSEKTSPQGTYTYMAPEVYNGEYYDYRIDIYSLGLILYRLLNKGRGPFQPLPPTIITSSISEESNQRRLRAEVLPRPVEASSRMSTIILKACAYNPAKRYQSPEELKDELIRCMASESQPKNKKQISNYIKRAATALQDSYEELFKENQEPANVDDINSVVDENEDYNPAKLKGSKNCHEKSMSDFFKSPGDL